MRHPPNLPQLPLASSVTHEYGATLSMLIAKGEHVLLYARKWGMARTPANFNLDDLQATLNSLHATFRCEHGPKNPRKTGQLIERLLNGSQPQNR